MPLRIPTVPGLAGTTLFAQVAWADACAPGGISASAGLALTLE